MPTLDQLKVGFKSPVLYSKVFPTKSLMQRPKVIFLDAVGTLFGKGSVGKVYSEMAQRFGVQVSDSTLDQAFLRSFPAAPPPIFPGTPADEIPECEFEWWNIVALCTFQQAGVLDQFSDFAFLPNSILTSLANPGLFIRMFAAPRTLAAVGN